MDFSDRLYFLDGAMGTMIQQYELTENDFHDAPFTQVKKELKGNNECLNLTHPEIIREIHRKYIEAGADIITTNTFSANRISQAEYGCEDYVYQMAYQGARIACEAAEGKALVAGSIGPTSKSLSLAPDISQPAFRHYSFDDMVAAFTEQAEGLIQGGADLLLLETCFDALNTKAMLYAIDKVSPGFPVIISVTASDRSGRTLTGQQLQAFYTSVSHYPLKAFGLNCSFGAEDLVAFVQDVASYSAVPVICYPNAGLPNEMGGYDESPEQMAAALKRMADMGLVNIVGGCCGTTPEHIRTIRQALTPNEECPVHKPAKPKACLTVSGLETVTLDTQTNNFTNIGERTNVAGSRKFAKLIAAGDYETALQIAAAQIENGASIIDINMDDAMLDSRKEMENFVRYISNDPAVAKAALMIDSSHWDTILAGLKNAQGKCIVNSISLKEGSEAFVEKAREISRMGAAMVVMAFDEQGQATTYERKIEICERAYRLLTEEAGVKPTDIIFDCNILSVGTGIEEHAKYAIDFIRAVQWIKQHLPGAYTSGGVSNLSFAFRGNNVVREAMHSAFLYHAIAAGLDMGIVNPGMLQIYDEIEPTLLKGVEDVIFNRDPDATERLIEMAQKILAEKKTGEDGKTTEATSQRRPLSAEERLQECLVKGKAVDLEQDLALCCEQLGSAVAVIEGPLMQGMERVGELFGAGKMFLPQVVKSAKIMRDCVAILQPRLTADPDSRQTTKKPRIVMATVKGDVHDIGKNITGIVFGCNGFEVIDLGVMVDKEVILAEAERQHADIVAVSGLITPSLFQMEELCREMNSRGMDKPLIVGGATTSALHTSVKLAPLYAHVFYGADASAAAVMAKRCIMNRAKFEDEEHAIQDGIRARHEARTIKQSCDSTFEPFARESFLQPHEHNLTSMPVRQLAIADLIEYIDWRMFLSVWGIKYGKLDHDDPNVAKVLAEGKTLLDQMAAENACEIWITTQIFDGWSEGNVLCAEGVRIPLLRQERDQHRSLCDYVPPKAYGITSPFGVFAVSVKPRHKHQEGCQCNACTHETNGLFRRMLTLVIAEAASRWLDVELEAQIHRKDVKVAKPAAGYACCPDHTLKKDILALLPDKEQTGITLSETYTMLPEASICGFIFAHPAAGYPDIHKISRQQYDAYAAERGMSQQEARLFLGHLL
uniref:Methionine synthase n=1 Tax=Prevotella sp. GTC17259 TaxID=3236795 RepID=A0AB33J6A7_9BACT